MISRLHTKEETYDEHVNYESYSNQIISEDDENPLSNYQLTRERVRRETRRLVRYGDVDMIYYTLMGKNEVYYNEQATYKESLASKDAMN